MKNLKYFILFFMIILFNCGFDMKDYGTFLQTYGAGTKTITCTYNIDIGKINSVSIKLYPSYVRFIYKYDEQIATVNYATISSSNGVYKAPSYEHDKTDVENYTFLYKYQGERIFHLENYIENYINSTMCPQTYLYWDSRNVSELQFYSYDTFSDSQRSNVITLTPVIENKSNNNCKVPNATACKSYTKETYLYGDFDIELGTINNDDKTRYYFNISKDDFSYTSTNQDTSTDSLSASYKLYSFLIRAKDYANLYLSNNTFPDDIYLDEVNIVGTNVVHITVPGSEVIDDYKDFAKPSDVVDKPADQNPTDNTSQKDLDVVDVDICNANDENNALLVFQIVGYVILVIKILVPVILIILGSIDLGKASLSGDDKVLKESTAKFVKRVLAGLIIFFVPTILDFFLSLVNGTSETKEKYEGCTSCIFHPGDASKCRTKKINGDSNTSNETEEEDNNTTSQPGQPTPSTK